MSEPANVAVELTILDVAFGGKGIGRLDGKVCFMPGVLPGERVRAALVKDHKDYFDAVPLAILDASPNRVEPACPLACRLFQISNLRFDMHCPGCAYQHTTYEEEIRLKQTQFRSLLARSAACDPNAVLDPIPSPQPLGYRNKMSLHAQRDGTEIRFGYFTEDNATVIDVPACPLAMPAINALLSELRAKPGFLGGLRDGMTVTFRWTERDGAVWWRGRAKERETWLLEASAIGPLSVPRNSFYQVNSAVANLLVRRVSELIDLQRPDAVVDLFCGIGIFASAAALHGVPSVTGVDEDDSGIAAARHNAKQRGLVHVEWIAAAAERAMDRLCERPSKGKTTLILDPPRAGLGQPLIRDIARLAPAHILYVSCAADTLSRDLAGLKEAGYTVRQSQLFDMFPRTAHFESLTELTRGRRGS